MPEALKRKLEAEARRRFPGDEERQKKYVYGTLANLKKKGVIDE